MTANMKCRSRCSRMVAPKSSITHPKSKQMQSKILRYKGYEATLVFDNSTSTLRGAVYGLPDDEKVEFEAVNPGELLPAFHRAVDNYLNRFECSGCKPPRPRLIPIEKIGDVVYKTDDALRSWEFDANLRWFIEHQKHLAWIYEGAFLTIHHQSVINSFRTSDDAREWAMAKFPSEPISVYPAIEGKSAYII